MASTPIVIDGVTYNLPGDVEMGVSGTSSETAAIAAAATAIATLRTDVDALGTVVELESSAAAVSSSDAVRLRSLGGVAQASEDGAAYRALPTEGRTKVFNAADPAYGLVGDGATDNATAYNTLRDALVTSGTGVMFFPPGTYAVASNAMQLRSPTGTIIRGSGPGQTVIKATSGSSAPILQSTTVALRTKLLIEDLAWENNSIASSSINLSGASVAEVVIRNCVFRLQGGTGITLTGVAHVTIENCTFYGQASGTGQAISITGGCLNARIRNNNFFGCHVGTSIDTGSTTTNTEDMAEFISWEGNFVDGMYFLVPPMAVTSPATQSGGTVTYTATDYVPATGANAAATITNSGGDFTTLTLTANDSCVRVMPVVRASTITSCTHTAFTDTGSGGTGFDSGAAGFLSDGLVMGDIIRVSGKFTTVRAVKSNTVLRIDGWYDATTFEPTTPPAATTAYTLYKAFIGIYFSRTATVFTTYDGLRDGIGNIVTISGGNWVCGGVTYGAADGSLYEVYKGGSYAGFHCETSAAMIRVTGNTVRRAWADNLSVFGEKAIVSNNICEQGGDLGINIECEAGGGHIVCTNNLLRYAGGNGIAIAYATSGLVAHNMIFAYNIGNAVDRFNVSGIVMSGCSYMEIARNYIDGLSRQKSVSGITLYPSAGATANNRLSNNIIKNVYAFGINVTDATTTDTNLRDNRVVGAGGAVTCIGANAGDTVTVNGVVFTARAAIVDAALDWLQTGNDQADAAALAAVINASADAAIAGIVSARSATGIMYFHSTGPYTLATSNATRLAVGTTAVFHRLSAVGGDYGTLRHTDFMLSGSPETNIVAGIGTMYMASTGKLWVKESGTSNTGWVEK